MKTELVVSEITECKKVQTNRISSMGQAALEINRLINAMWAQGACFVDVTWDSRSRRFSVFAKRTRYPDHGPMTTKTKITTVTLTALACIAAIAETWGEAREKREGHPRTYGASTDLETVVWQYDKYRAEIERVKALEAQAAEFNRTNTDGSSMVISRSGIFRWQPQKGEIETGYRSDGVVVWRALPEGK